MIEYNAGDIVDYNGRKAVVVENLGNPMLCECPPQIVIRFADTNETELTTADKLNLVETAS